MTDPAACPVCCSNTGSCRCLDYEDDEIPDVPYALAPDPEWEAWLADFEARIAARDVPF